MEGNRARRGQKKSRWCGHQGKKKLKNKGQKALIKKKRGEKKNSFGPGKSKQKKNKVRKREFTTHLELISVGKRKRIRTEKTTLTHRRNLTSTLEGDKCRRESAPLRKVVKNCLPGSKRRLKTRPQLKTPPIDLTFHTHSSHTPELKIPIDPLQEASQSRLSPENSGAKPKKKNKGKKS